MTGLLAAFALAAALAPVLVARLGPRAFYLLALVPLATVVWAIPRIGDVTAGGAVESGFDWVPELGVRLAFRLDALSLVMLLVVAGVGALVLAYCARYFTREEVGLGRFAAVLTAFAGAMLGLVLADDLISLYVFWELTTIGSFLLVGHNTDQGGARRAAIDALVVTTFGGLAMLVGFVMLGTAAGTFSISALGVVANPSGPLVDVALILIVLGAITKSALFPFHFWLPGAMAAPTPVSAYLHAAAMVKAGPYLIGRLMPGFSDVPGWRTVVVVLGVVTMLAGAWRALRQFDLKLLLAHGTVSQLGLLMILFGAGTPNATLAAMAMLLAHAMYKAPLFLVVGAIDKATATRDLRRLTALAKTDRRLAAVTLLAALSMAGFPPLLGFAAKESVYEAFEHGSATDTLLLFALALGSLLTVAYAIRFAWGALATKPECKPLRYDRPRGTLIGAPALLAVGGLVLGVLAGGLDALMAEYAGTVVAPPAAIEGFAGGGIVGVVEAPSIHLAAWHGFGIPLLITAIALVGGAALFAARGALAPLQDRLAHAFDARDGYVAIVRGLERLSLRVTVVTQSGSLPVYLATICLVLIAGAAVALISGVPFDVDVRAWDSPAQAAVVVVMLVAAGLALTAQRRLKAVTIVGVVGYAMALLFALAGAPDLALTQFLAETVTLVIVVLVLRRLPPKFAGRSTSPARRRVNVALGLGVGVAMALLTVVATGARDAPPASAGFPAGAEQAGGDNLVNVTLVEFRAWDTMGETGVLVVAATGVTSLIFLGRRRRKLPRRDETDVPRPERAWLRAEETVAPERRSLLLEVAARVTFHTIWVVAIYLLIVGHDLPGGGFAGGIVAGLALVVRYLAGGRYELGETLPVGAGALLGWGLVVATLYALGGAIFGDAVLQSAKWEFSVPVIGDVKLVASLVFDIGIFLVVVGAVLDILRAFGAEIDRQEAEA